MERRGHERTLNEASKFTAQLIKRTQEKDLCKSGRMLIPRVPTHLMVGCCVRWIGDPYELPAVKATALKILRQETCGKTPGAWIISLIFQEVCRHTWPGQLKPTPSRKVCPENPACKQRQSKHPLVDKNSCRRGNVSIVCACMLDFRVAQTGLHDQAFS